MIFVEPRVAFFQIGKRPPSTGIYAVCTSTPHPMDPFNESELIDDLSQTDQLENDKGDTPDFDLSSKYINQAYY